MAVAFPAPHGRPSFDAYVQYHVRGLRPSASYRCYLESLEQRSDAWRINRERFLSASDLSKAIGTSQYCTQREYFLELTGAAEPRPIDSRQLELMEMGRKLEPRVLDLYERCRVAGLLPWASAAGPSRLWHCGLALDREKPFLSCSPDALVGEEGGVEIKCRAPCATRARANKTLPPDHMTQVQACIRIFDADWWDYASYWHRAASSWRSNVASPTESELAVTRVRRCDAFWDAASRLATRFLEAVAAQRARDALEDGASEGVNTCALSRVRDFYAKGLLPQSSICHAGDWVFISDMLYEENVVLLSDEIMNRCPLGDRFFNWSLRFETEACALICDPERVSDARKAKENPEARYAR